MSNRGALILIGSIVLFFGAILYFFYEVKNVPDLNWRADYRYESQEPFGTWLFREMLREKYGEENIYRNNIDLNIEDIEDSGNLYIMMYSFHIEQEKLKKIKNFIHNGNDLLVIGKSNLISLDLACANPRRTDYSKNAKDSVLNFFYTSDPDSIYSFKYYSRGLEEPTVYNYRFPEYTAEVSDSSDLLCYNKIMEHDSAGTIFMSWEFPYGSIYKHTAPYMFANISSKQSYFLEHFNTTLAPFTPRKIILDHVSYEPLGFGQAGSKDSPLEYFLAEESLRWGYYTLLVAFLCYLLFRGKRKQKAIPLLEQNENTTLSYVDTLSELYLSQDQNRKLVPHLEEIFLHHVQSKYFLQPAQENFEHLLSRKSKIPTKEISLIMKGFKNQKDGFEFNDDQLATLHQRIENFYKNAE